MRVINETVDTIIKRPFLIAFEGVVVAVFLILNFYNPILPIILGVTSITKSTIFESVVAALQIVSDPGFLPIIALALLGAAIVASLLFGVLMSGFMFSLNRTLDELPARKGEFLFGIKKYFVKVFLVNLRTTLVTILFGAFMAIACVPAIVVTKSATTDRPELLAPAILVDFLTVAVVLFGLTFFTSYTLFWYPAVFKNIKKAFVAGKKAVDKGFWKIAGIFLVFDLVFAAFQYLIYIIQNPLIKFTVSWLFWTLFILALIVYVFSSFKEFSKPAEK